MRTQGVGSQRERKRAQRARLRPGDMALDPLAIIAGSPSPAGSSPDTDALSGAAPAMLIVWDDECRCTSVELAGGLEVDGTVGEALRGDGWLQLLDPDDRARAAALVHDILDEATASTRGEDGIRLSRADGWAVLRVHRREGGGASGVLVDATRSYGSTARLARLVENLNQLRREDDIVRAILSEGVSLLGAHSATVHVLDDACSELVMMGSVGVPPDELHEAFGRMPVDAPLPAVDAMRSG